MDEVERCEQESKGRFRRLCGIVAEAYVVTGNPSEPYTVTYDVTWHAPLDKCSYMSGRRGLRGLWSAWSVFHFQLLFYLIHQWEENNNHLNVRNNNHSNNIGSHKCQEIPGGRNYWNDMRGCTQKWKNKCVPTGEKTGRNKEQGPGGEKSPGAVVLFLSAGTTCKAPGHERSVINARSASRTSVNASDDVGHWRRLRRKAPQRASAEV